jgi:hypothetical protein
MSAAVVDHDVIRETPRIVRSPSVSLATLARVTGAMSPRSLKSLLRGHKYQTGGPARSYQNARRQAIDFLVDSVPFDADAELRPHEREAVRAMKRAKPTLPTWARALRAETRAPSWVMGGVRISMHPDVVIDAREGCGAAKLSLTKERLAPGVGQMMASLLYYWRAEVLRLPAVRRDYCVVFEPRLPWLHRPAKNLEKSFEDAELACRVIASLWPHL